MAPRIDYAKLVPCAEVAGEDAEDQALLRELIDRGRSYLSSFEWCRDIIECHLGDIAVGGVVAVLLMKIEPAHDDVPEWHWVVVGDLPPAYIAADDAPNSAAALDAYIGEMQQWIDAVKAGDPVDDLIPVETSDGGESLEARSELAHDLERRLRFLDREILPFHGEDLRE